MHLDQPTTHLIVGARPNYMKVKVLLDLLPHATLVHTGQHYSAEMFGSFLEQLGMRAPDLTLEPRRDSQVTLIASTMMQLEQLWHERRPRLVIVVGDVNATLAAALVASRGGIPVAHVEAGLRSRDLSMPEEVNRIATDACSSFLFCSEPAGVENLEREGRRAGVVLAGNTMIDCLVALRPRIEARAIRAELGLGGTRYAVLTLHRPANVDDPARLAEILGFLDATGTRFVYPVHPRVAIPDRFRNIRLVPPLGYLDFLKLVTECDFVFTDSGGIQEETTFLSVPCVTYRTTTERPWTVEHGTNELLTSLAGYEGALERARGKRGSVPACWDGRASERIVSHLVDARALLEEGLASNLPSDR